MVRDHGFHPVRITRIIQETADTCTYVLDVPPTSPSLFSYRAGQFLTFRVCGTLDQLDPLAGASSAPFRKFDRPVDQHGLDRFRLPGYVRQRRVQDDQVGRHARPHPEEEARALSGAAARNPQASVVLGQVLKITETLPVGAALEAESFAYSTLLGGPEFGRWLGARGDRPLPPPAELPVIVRRDGTRLLITLNRPERRNAYGRQLRDALTDALRVALLDPAVTGVVLDGAGPCFCSGGDLAEFGTTPDLATAHFVRTCAGAARLIGELGPRIEARVHGPCAGAGIELAAFAGTVVADAGTTFRLPEVSMGLIPGAGGTVSIPQRIGRWRTLYLALTGQPLDVASALAWGLVDANAGHR